MNSFFCLVIDADIARASGLSEHPVSSGSRSLLEYVKNHGHQIVLCPKLLKEWKKHRSTFAKKWLSSMIAKKKVCFLKSEDVIEITVEKINIHITNQNEKSIALKDAHLIDIALIKDKIVISNDNRARNVFCILSSSCGEIRDIKWLNCVLDKDFICNFLEKSCFIPKIYYLSSS